MDVASVRFQGPPVPFASVQLLDGVVASPKMSVPAVKFAPKLTVRAALMSRVLKSAMASKPEATVPLAQFDVLPQVELEEALVQVPSVAREE